MKAGKVIEQFLMKKCEEIVEGQKEPSCCIVTSPLLVPVISKFVPNSYVVSNSAIQVFPNIGSVFFAVRELKVKVVAIVGSSATDLERVAKFEFHGADVEFKLLKKTYEENMEIMLSLYEDDETYRKSAMMEINIDAQIEKLLSISEISEQIESENLTVCGIIFDEHGVYGSSTAFYLTNLNGIKDPEEIKSSKILSEIPESVKKQKIKRLIVQI
jgi:carbonic anhydrase